jgi:hypothetical protein
METIANNSVGATERRLKQVEKDDWKTIVRNWIKLTKKREELEFFEPLTLVLMREHATKKQREKIDALVVSKLAVSFDFVRNQNNLPLRVRTSINRWLNEIIECEKIPAEIRAIAKDGMVGSSQHGSKIEDWIQQNSKHAGEFRLANVDELVSVLKSANADQRKRIQDTVINQLFALERQHERNDDSPKVHKYSSLTRGWILDLAFNSELTERINRIAQLVWKNSCRLNGQAAFTLY